jgi:acyl carrier protein
MSDTIKNTMAQIFGIPAEEISASSSPETIAQWDSLKHMQLIMALEDELGIEFTDDMIPQLLSFEAIERAVLDLTGG